MKSIQIIIQWTLLIHIILTGGAVGFTPSTTQSIRPFQTTALNEVTNDNAERQLRVIDLPTELAAFEYVNDHDYAAYDIFEDADRYDYFIFIYLCCLKHIICSHSHQSELSSCISQILICNYALH